jgi:hypothetical protein
VRTPRIVLRPPRPTVTQPRQRLPVPRMRDRESPPDRAALGVRDASAAISDSASVNCLLPRLGMIGYVDWLRLACRPVPFLA